MLNKELTTFYLVVVGLHLLVSGKVQLADMEYFDDNEEDDIKK